MNTDQFLALFETQMKDGEYEGAYRSLKQLQSLGLEEPHLLLLTARLYDCTDRVAEAEQIFRSILKSNATNLQISQARQGLNTIQMREKQRRQASITLEMTDPKNQDDGLLLLFPVDTDSIEKKAEALARVFNLDIYTARSLCPKKYCKIYRLGRYGEMKVYSRELKDYGIDALAVRLKTIEEMTVYSVLYLEENKNGLTFTTKKGEFNIPWSSIKRIVKGEVPILEEVVVGVDRKYQIAKEEKTKEFLRIIDLHCDVVFRLENQQYQFNQGKKFMGDHATMTAKWKEMNDWLIEMTGAEVIDHFLPFGEMALLYPETLQKINPKLSFNRVKECLWDNSFELYSFLFGRELCI